MYSSTVAIVLAPIGPQKSDSPATRRAAFQVLVVINLIAADWHIGKRASRGAYWHH
jgi:hypothetical protein